MRQVDRKFLEEQVKIALRESNLPKEQKQAINEIVGMHTAAIWYAFKDEPWFQKILDFVIAVLVGSKESWKTVYDASKRTAKYGAGLEGIYAKVQREEELDKVQAIAFRLLDPKLTAGGQLTAEFRDEPFKDFYRVIKQNAPLIARAKSDRQISSALIKFYKEADEVVEKHVLGNPEDQEFLASLFSWRSSLAKGLIELFTGDVSRKHYNPGHTNKSWISQETKATKKLAGDVGEIKKRLESGILFTLGIGTHIDTFGGFSGYLHKDSSGQKLIGVLAAAAAAKYHDEQPVFLAFADILLSLIGTVAMIISFGSSTAISAPAQAALKGATMTATATSFTATTGAKMTAIFASKTYFIAELGFTFAHMLDQVTETLGPNVSKYNNYTEVYFDILENNRYAKSAGNPLDDDWDFDDAAVLVYKGLIGSDTEEPEEGEKAPGDFVVLQPAQAKQLAERIRVQKMDPLLDKITGAFYSEHGKAMAKLKIAVPKLQKTDFQKTKIMKALQSGDKATHSKYIQNIMQYQKQLEEYAKVMDSTTKKAQALGKKAEAAAKITDAAHQRPIIKPAPSVLENEPSAAIEPETPDEKPTSKKPQPGEFLVFGDSIALGIKQSLGASGTAAIGLRTGTILKNMQTYFAKTAIEEAASEKTIVLSAGINDLAAGVPPEKIISNLGQIIDLAKSKGYDVRVVPLLGLRGEKKEEISKINNALVGRGDVSVIDKTGVKLGPDGIHPAGYKTIAKNASSGITTVGKSAQKTPKAEKDPAQKLTGGAAKYYPLIKKYSEQEGMNTALMMGITFAESGFNPKAKSSAGAMGLMQLMPITVKGMGVKDPYDPEDNIKGGIKAFRKIRNSYVPAAMKNAAGGPTKIKFEDLDDDQKDRLALYAYNWGPTGIVNKLEMNKHKTIDDFFSKVNKHYMKKHGYDYSIKILGYAAKFGGTAVVAGDAPLDPQKATEPESPDGKPLTDYLTEVEQIDNFPDLTMYFYKLFRISATGVQSRKSKMKTIVSDLESGNLSTYAKDSTEYLKLQHKSVGSRWKREFKAEMAAAKGDKEKEELARKKIAYRHRPVFFGELFTISIPNIDSSHVSLAFEPGTKRVSTYFGKTSTFYKQDHQGNSNFNKLLSKLKELTEISSALISKLQELSNKEEKKEALNNYLSFTSDFYQIVSGATKILTDGGEASVRKAYATYVLNRAFTAVT